MRCSGDQLLAWLPEVKLSISIAKPHVCASSSSSLVALCLQNRMVVNLLATSASHHLTMFAAAELHACLVRQCFFSAASTGLEVAVLA